MTYNRRFSEENAVLFWEFDTSVKGAATLTNVNSTGWIDMKHWGKITCLIVRNAGSGAIQNAGLYVSAASTGTSASAITTTGSTTVTGIWGSTVAKGTNNATTGNQGAGLHIIEANQDEIAGTLSGGRYVSARISGAAAADEYLVCYILSDPRHKEASMIASGDSTQTGGPEGG